MSSTKPRFDDYLTVRAAAARLGVYPGTLPNWDRADRLKTVRHPMAGYQLYCQFDLEAILATADNGFGPAA
jgi:hypothetical protein